MRLRAVAFTAIILLILAVVCSRALADGVVSKWGQNGWDVTSTLTHPGTVEGTQITLEASATYYLDGVQQEVKAEPVILTVGKSTVKNEWVTANPLPSWAQIEIPANTGSGGCEVQADGKLRWWVTANNDGMPVAFSYRIRYHPP